MLDSDFALLAWLLALTFSVVALAIPKGRPVVRVLTGKLTKGYGKDLGYDLYSAEELWIPPMSVRKVHTGTRLYMPEVGGIIKDRSSLASLGLVTHGGVIDPGYDGELIVTVGNPTDDTKQVKVGQKVAQIVFVNPAGIDVPDAEVEKPDEKRGSKGFGSTGV